MEYVSDIIGDEYLNWRTRYKIFISAPTGSGKTYFILHVLLPYAYQQGKRILYLVNRHILKEQMESEISNFPAEQTFAIRIELYQTLENIMCSLIYDQFQHINRPLGYDGLKYLEEYDYVVCDECHYFLADSNFNTNTCWSFQWIQDVFSCKIRIFISATIKDIKDYIMKDDDNRQYQRTKFFGFHIGRTEEERALMQSLYGREEKKEYEIEPDYDYLLINIINNRYEISNLVLDRDKWLIFVDNISWGKELQTELQNQLLEKLKEEQKKKLQDKLKKELPEERLEETVEELIDVYRNQLDIQAKKNVIMLSSDYKKNEESEQEVDYIRKDNKQSAKVLISTSVMDNGINLKDISLRNIVLVADTEVEFIQMLGRKRRDGGQVKLYIYKHDRNHFANRLQEIKRARKIAVDYWNEAKQSFKNSIAVNWSFAEYSEMQFIVKQHEKIMQGISNHQLNSEDVGRVFNVFGGILYFNHLSFTQIDNLVQYYNKIIEKFYSEDDDAFIKEQLNWLGLKDKQADEIINESRKNMEESCRTNLINEFDKVIGQRMKYSEARVFKNRVRGYLLILVETVDNDNDEKQSVIGNLERNDRPLVKNQMDFFQKYLDFPYGVNVEKNSDDSTEKNKSFYTYYSVE